MFFIKTHKMNKSKCVLCNALLDLLKYDLRETNSLYTHTPLITFIEDITSEFFNTHFNACMQCYNLINELDNIALRQKEIHSLFKQYVEDRKLNNILQTRPGRPVSFITSYSEGIQKSSNSLGSVESSVISQLDDIDNLLNCSDNNVVEDINHETSDLKEVDLFNNDLIIMKHNLNEATENCDNGCGNKEESKTKIQPKLKKTDKASESEKKDQDIFSLQKNHKCQCSKTFRTLGELKNHMNSHNDHYPFICEICGQLYKHKSNFSVHMDMHTGINRFTCSYCKKSFTQKGALARHVPIHTGEMPYQCDECGKRFVHHTSFNYHRKTHVGERSFKCEICGLATMSGSHLKRHLRVHTGEKKYTCSTCGKCFAEKYNLAAHEKLHNKSGTCISRKKKYSCRVCGSSYERKVKLDEHLVNEHETIKPEFKGKLDINCKKYPLKI